jgi:hypothetical protein
VRVLAEELAHQLLHFRHAGRSADQHDLVDLAWTDTGVGERLLHRAHRALQQIVDELFELRARQLDLQVPRPAGVRGDERQVDLGLHRRGQLDLGLLRALLQTLERHAILRQIDTVALPELGGEPFDDAIVDVVAAKMRVAVGRLDLDDAVAHLEHGNVEGAAAEVVHGNRFVFFLVEAVSQGRGGRLVDDAQDVQAGNRAGILRRLTLGVVEVRRNGDDRVGDFFAEVVVSGLLQLLQDHSRDFGR